MRLFRAYMLTHARLLTLVAVLPALSAAGSDSANAGNGRFWGLEFSGSIGWNTSRFTRARHKPNIQIPSEYLNGVVFQTLSGGFTAVKHVSPRFSFTSGLAGNIWAPMQSTKEWEWNKLTRNINGWLSVANAHVLVGDVDRPYFDLTAGLFDYNYTGLTQDFGGYLYTAGIHPGWLASSGGTAPLAGLKISSGYLDWLSHDLLLTLETDRPPYFDFSIGYVASADIGSMVNIGAGVVGWRLIPGTSEDKDSTRVYDEYLSADGERIKCYYRDVKLMGRFALDPMSVIPENDFLGPRDLRLYAEGAVLGLQNYPESETGRGYPRIEWRIPVMAGLNLPTHPLVTYGIAPLGASLFLIANELDTIRVDSVDINSDGSVAEEELDTVTVTKGFQHKPARPYVWAAASVAAGVGSFFLDRYVGKMFRLDQLTLEVEYYQTPYDVSFHGITALPTLVDVVGTENVTYWHEDDWRWALIAKKRLFEMLDVRFKIASDHMRVLGHGGFYYPLETLKSYKEWYWSLDLSVGF
ncbi:MAG: hypothetical protein GF418_01675 [Chitinivibrionales bacterium]|nr:hypothetical protein [Chitinivibrionales bacterium]MBD3394311.1 hypothetical protein [Chitinivibrionales bacterium]